MNDNRFEEHFAAAEDCLRAAYDGKHITDQALAEAAVHAQLCNALANNSQAEGDNRAADDLDAISEVVDREQRRFRVATPGRQGQTA